GVLAGGEVAFAKLVRRQRPEGECLKNRLCQPELVYPRFVALDLVDVRGAAQRGVEQEVIGSGASSQHIVAPPTVEKIVARATGEEVGGCISEKIVAAAAADGALDRLELFRETRPKLDIGGKVDGDVVGLVAVLDDVETVAAVKEVKAGTPDE